MMVDTTELRDRLQPLTATADIPAVSVAVLQDGQVSAAATGILNRDTGVEATTDSLFQIGSVTKTYTSAMVMRLVEQGRLELDRPVQRDLPEFTVADAETTATVTPRHLLAHTSGIDGDNFTDTGRGDDALERYLATCADLEQSSPLGAAFSYCNTGYGILGRLVERVTGKTWDEALAELVIGPLGLDHTVTLPEDALRFRAAHGHVPDADGQMVPAPQWGMPRSSGPAGGACATALDVVSFARLLLDGGRASDGTPVLSADGVAAMSSAQVPVPDPSLGTAWGLGMSMLDVDGTRVYGHDGGTVGQGAFLRWIPAKRAAVAVLGNSMGLSVLRDQLLPDLVEEVAGARLPGPLEPTNGSANGAGGPGQWDAWTGSYRRTNFRLDVSQRESGLHGRVGLEGPAATALGRSDFEGQLLPAGADGQFVTQMLTAGEWMPVVFFRGSDGARYCHMAGRAQRNTEDA